jgi:hypothetical protein
LVRKAKSRVKGEEEWRSGGVEEWSGGAVEVVCRRFCKKKRSW